MRGSARPRMLSAATLAVGAVLAVAEASAAQGRDGGGSPGRNEDRDFRMDAWAGIAIPTADMRHFVDEGRVLGAGLAYRIGERLSVRGDWTAALMRPANRTSLRARGADFPVRGSEMDLHHLTGGVQVELSRPGMSDIEVRAHAGLGVTFLSTEKNGTGHGRRYYPVHGR